MSGLRDAALQLCRALESLDIDYAIGGSYARSVHGIARATQDLDIIAAITLPQAEQLAQVLKVSFYADSGQMRDAILQGRSFNVIHLATAFRLDIFPASSHPQGRQEIKRRQFPVSLPVISAEDIVLAKLRECKDGGRSSERQWNDLLNITKSRATVWTGLICRNGPRFSKVGELLAALLNE